MTPGVAYVMQWIFFSAWNFNNVFKISVTVLKTNDGDKNHHVKNVEVLSYIDRKEIFIHLTQLITIIQDEKPF
jgi:hypothetical protein